jgi:SH3 domain-containing YSC84-like protein 1
MKNRKILYALILAFLLSTTNLGVNGQDHKLKDAAEESAKAAEALREIMGIPEKAIPKGILDEADCVAVFPSTIKGGFIFGVRKGDGVISCRTASGWSSPAFLDLSGGSVGAQIGAQSTDYVLLFMNRSGADKLLTNKLTLGGEASVAAGPVGREAGASTDWKLNSQILSYSRSKGLFAGVELKGVVISIDDSDMKDVYGAEGKAKAVLMGGQKVAPEIMAFPNELTRFSSSN